jgi:tripartite-type tricarboxylate transporter receptor subunit TctC
MKPSPSFDASARDQRAIAMNLPRRRFLHLFAGAAAIPATSRIVTAQGFPSWPVRVVVPTAAGGAADILARLMGQRLSDRLGQQVVIDNRPGGGSNVGTEAVVKAAPDGYTLLLVTTSAAINATLYDKLNFNFIRDIAPVAGIIRSPVIMVVNPSVPAKTVAEFIAYAKANPGKLNMASGGAGAGTHLAGELFKMMASVRMVHVPYRGVAPALTDLLAGRVQVLFVNPASSMEHIRSGKLRALAITSAMRSELLQDIPSVAEFVPGYDATFWFGLGAPRNTPSEIIDRLNKEVNAALAEPATKARLADLDGTALAGSPADFGKFVAEETQKWGNVIKFAGVKPE